MASSSQGGGWNALLQSVGPVLGAKKLNSPSLQDTKTKVGDFVVDFDMPSPSLDAEADERRRNRNRRNEPRSSDGVSFQYLLMSQEEAYKQHTGLQGIPESTPQTKAARFDAAPDTAGRHLAYFGQTEASREAFMSAIPGSAVYSFLDGDNAEAIEEEREESRKRLKLPKSAKKQLARRNSRTGVYVCV
jgi:hypothetical protein